MASTLQQAISLIRAGDKQQGRRLLLQLIRAEPRNETAWLWLSGVVDRDEQRRDCLRRALAINPDNKLAQKGLRSLESKEMAAPAGPPAPPLPAESHTAPDADLPAAESPPPGREPIPVSPAPPGPIEEPPVEVKPVAGPEPEEAIEAEAAAAEEKPEAPADEPLELPEGLHIPALEEEPEASPAAAPAGRFRTALLLGLVTLVLLGAVCVGVLAILAANWPLPFPGLIESGLALDLSNRGLTDDQLAALLAAEVPRQNPRILDLSGNQLTTLPPAIGQLKRVEWLYAKHNRLNTLPPEIGQLSGLKLLILQDNQLTALPPEIGQLTNLEHLDVQSNQLRTLPREIGRLPNLKLLNVQNNPIQQLPPEIATKSGLTICIGDACREN